MRHLLIPQTKEQAEEFLRLAEVEASKFGVSRTLPKDVEDFIAGNAWSISVKDEYGDTHYGVDSIDVDDLRAWMTGHVRAPVEPISRAMVALERFANDTVAGRNSAHELRELLSAVKEEGK